MGTLKNKTDEAKDVPLLRRTVDAKETVEVDDALLTDPALVWPAGVWEVNGGPHEHDPNSPENLAKAEAERVAAEEAAAKAADKEAAAAARAAKKAPVEPLTADPAGNPNPAPADEVTE